MENTRIAVIEAVLDCSPESQRALAQMARRIDSRVGQMIGETPRTGRYGLAESMAITLNRGAEEGDPSCFRTPRKLGVHAQGGLVTALPEPKGASL